MSIALKSPQQNWEQRLQTLSADPIGCFPQHDQRAANGFIVERSTMPAMADLAHGSAVQYANRGLLVIPGCRDELFEDLALLLRPRTGAGSHPLIPHAR